MRLTERDPFGFEQVIYHPASGTIGTGLRELMRRESLAVGPVDTGALAGHLRGARLTGRSVLHDFRSLPPGHVLTASAGGGQTTAVQAARSVAGTGDLETLLFASLRRVIDSGRPAALALSGGLDSALLLAMLHAAGATTIPVYILATSMAHYDERDGALATAQRLGAQVVVVETGPDDFVDALPETMRHLEEPLHNMHPVAKLLLATAMRRDGIEVAISGDGADQVLARDVSADYLPLCRQLFAGQGITLVPPFVDADVVAHLTSIPPDPDKACIRRLGRRFAVAAQLVDGPKRGRLAPAMLLDHLLPADRIAHRAHTLGMPAPALATDAERVRWATLLLLLDDLGIAA